MIWRGCKHILTPPRSGSRACGLLFLYCGPAQFIRRELELTSALYIFHRAPSDTAPSIEDPLLSLHTVNPEDDLRCNGDGSDVDFIHALNHPDKPPAVHSHGFWEQLQDVWELFSSLWSAQPPQDEEDSSWQVAPKTGPLRPQDLSSDGRTLSQIPQYVIDYAPLVHLYSEEQYWPCDVREHLQHVKPELNFSPLEANLQHVELNNLSSLNRFDYAKNIFLTSKDNVEDHPDWLMGEKNIPAAGSRPHSGRSGAPAVLIAVDKGDGIVDAFWFFFYSFNLGNVVVLRFGNHVGDWEHTLVRFKNGKPMGLFVSEHFFGQAYNFAAVEKVGGRPVVYSAIGTHAMYADPGLHAYVLPWSILHDSTDRGPLWDPALNSLMYTYDTHNDTLRSSNFTPDAATDWFHFAGHWGDKQYSMTDSRQYGLGANTHYVDGPLGPKFKNLGRRKMCQGPENEKCNIREWLGGTRIKRVKDPSVVDEMSRTERDRFAKDHSDMS